MLIDLDPVRPAETASTDEIDLYQFRKGASVYFTGGTAVIEPETAGEAVIVTRRKKTQVVEGGC